jgi:hypothetical protein
MKPARDNNHFAVSVFIDQPVLIVDPPRPEPGQLAFQRLRFANAVKRIAQDVFDQHIDALDDFPLGALPM